MKTVPKITEKLWFERAYKITVGVKGFDGLVELAAGILLAVAPGLLHWLLGAFLGETLEYHGRFAQFLAAHIAHIDTDLATHGATVAVIFLISHGVIKLILVYCLLKEILWAYPYALGVLGLFLVYQVYVFVRHPTLGMALFCLLDVLIIWLVTDEWRKLRFQRAEKIPHSPAA